MTPAARQTVAAPRTPPPPSELDLLKLMMLAPESCALYTAHDIEALVTHPGIRDAAERLTRRWESDGAIELASFVSSLDDTSLRETLFKSLASTPPLGDDWMAPFEQLETRLKREAFQRRLAALKLDERRATLAGDEPGATRLQMERVKVQRQLEALRATRG